MDAEMTPRAFCWLRDTLEFNEGDCLRLLLEGIRQKRKLQTHHLLSSWSDMLGMWQFYLTAENKGFVKKSLEGIPRGEVNFLVLII